MNVLIIGSGGREHALLKACLASPLAKRVIAAPGNGGMAAEAECIPLDVEDVQAAVALVRREKVDLAIIGPEVPLALGMGDALRAEGVLVYGPDKDAAQLEASKAFSKDFFTRYGIPAAASRTFGKGETDAAIDYITKHSLPIVVKASGLAAGKGVIIAQTAEEAIEAVRGMHSGEMFGESGAEVVIEEYLDGEEASVTLMVCGDRYVLLPAAQDHKRIGEGDTGPNTGGMGAYAPAAVITPVIEQQIRETVILPTLEGFVEEGFDFRGTLFIGIMVTKAGPKVLEFNVRFGDPETQVMLPLIDGDPLQMILDCARGTLDPATVKLKQGYAMVVVLAAKGYPGSYTKGEEIKFPTEAADHAYVVHAGTKRLDDGRIVSAGGRVLGVTAFGETLQKAADRTYALVDKIDWPGKAYRRDIGHRQLNRGS